MLSFFLQHFMTFKCLYDKQDIIQRIPVLEFLFVLLELCRTALKDGHERSLALSTVVSAVWLVWYTRFNSLPYKHNIIAHGLEFLIAWVELRSCNTTFQPLLPAVPPRKTSKHLLLRIVGNSWGDKVVPFAARAQWHSRVMAWDVRCNQSYFVQIYKLYI